MSLNLNDLNILVSQMMGTKGINAAEAKRVQSAIFSVLAHLPSSEAFELVGRGIRQAMMSKSGKSEKFSKMIKKRTT